MAQSGETLEMIIRREVKKTFFGDNKSEKGESEEKKLVLGEPKPGKTGKRRAGVAFGTWGHIQDFKRWKLAMKHNALEHHAVDIF